jgi:hypothetical protein
MNARCSDCDNVWGKLVSWESADGRCRVCHGAGRGSSMAFGIEQDCDACHGSGTCQTCHGLGEAETAASSDSSFFWSTEPTQYDQTRSEPPPLSSYSSSPSPSPGISSYSSHSDYTATPAAPTHQQDEGARLASGLLVGVFGGAFFALVGTLALLFIIEILGNTKVEYPSIIFFGLWALAFGYCIYEASKSDIKR